MATDLTVEFHNEKAHTWINFLIETRVTPLKLTFGSSAVL